jgi:membrane associated rhomboid family serine protease
MNLNDFLIWTVCFACTLSLIRIIRYSPRQNLGWMVVCSSILGGTVAMLFLIPHLAGLTGAILWGVLFLVPNLGFLIVNRLVYKERYHQAYQLAICLSWLHPADGWRQQARMLYALAMAKQGQLTQASQILEKNSYHGQVLLYWINADWKQCLIWFNQFVPLSILHQDPFLMVYYLRVLGETGNLNILLEEIDNFERYLFRLGLGIQLSLVRMYAFAFCGQTAQVRQLFKGPLGVYSKQIESFWITTAKMAAGQKQFACQELLKLRLWDNLILNNAIEWRLSHSLVDADLVLNQHSRDILFRIQTSIKQELSYVKVINLKQKKAYITWLLIGINLLFFGLEIVQGGSENIDTLYYLGALVPEDVWHGQFWRLITANFLHYGWLHLLNNLFALYFLGCFVELNLGIRRYLLAYFISGIGAMFLFTYLSMKLAITGQILVGASAAIMGLIGVICAMSLRDWYREKSRITAQRLQLIVIIISIQFIFDSFVPEVSFLSHLLGVILGFIVGLLLLL